MPLSRRLFIRHLTAAAATTALPAAQGKRPNILFAIFDDWGYGHAGAYGAKWIRTPAFDRIAKEGVLFTHCFTSNPKCSPCRATILTGRNSWQLKEAVSHNSIMPNDFPVYPALLEKAGYFVGLTGKGWGPGDFKSSGFPHNPAGREFTKYRSSPPFKGIGTNDYARNFEYFLEERAAGPGKDQPFCFWMGFQEPHRTYEEGSGMRAGRNVKEVPLPPYYPQDSTLIQSDMLDYAMEVEWADRHLSQVLKKLEAVGELDNTLLIATSDHGMPFPRVKGQIYEDGFHIPLAIRWGSGMTGGRVSNDFVNMRDFAPTFLEVAGVSPPSTITGKSFLNILKSNQSGIVDPSRDVMLTGKERHDLGRPNDAGYPVRAIRTRQYLYIRNYAPESWPAGNPETGYRNVDDSPTKTMLLSSFDKYYRLSFGKRAAEELYDIEADPGCLNNLSAAAGFTAIRQDLQTRMEKLLREEGDPRLNGGASFFDTIKYVGPRKHSYEQWLKNQAP